jgi:alkylation response protein AidB-like acyl-CoA dehydrogenase
MRPECTAAGRWGWIGSGCAGQRPTLTVDDHRAVSRQSLGPEEIVTAIDDADRRELRSTARGFFEKYSDESAVRSTMETDEGFDRALWSRMADELGLQGLLIPDRFGGTDLSFIDLEIVMEEMGRALVCAPFLSSAVLCTTALLVADDQLQSAALLPQLARGSVIAALAFADQQGRWDPTGTAVQGRRNGRSPVSGATSSTVRPPTWCWSRRPLTGGRVCSPSTLGPRVARPSRSRRWT